MTSDELYARVMSRCPGGNFRHAMLLLSDEAFLDRMGLTSSAEDVRTLEKVIAVVYPRAIAQHKKVGE